MVVLVESVYNTNVIFSLQVCLGKKIVPNFIFLRHIFIFVRVIGFIAGNAKIRLILTCNYDLAKAVFFSFAACQLK
jgi:hypothetical protein